MNIRIGTPEDAFQIATIHCESWKSAYQSIIPAAHIARITPQARLTHWQQEIANGVLDIYVKVDDSDLVVGWMAAGPDRDFPEDRDCAEIHALYIAPEHMGKGIGRELLDHVTPLLKAAGRSKIVLWVLEKNEPALRFYDKCGFKKTPMAMTIERGGIELVELKLEKLIGE